MVETRDFDKGVGEGEVVCACVFVIVCVCSHTQPHFATLHHILCHTLSITHSLSATHTSAMPYTHSVSLSVCALVPSHLSHATHSPIHES